MATFPVPTLDGSGKVRDKHLPDRLSEEAQNATYAGKALEASVDAVKAKSRNGTRINDSYSTAYATSVRPKILAAKKNTGLMKVQVYGDSIAALGADQVGGDIGSWPTQLTNMLQAYSPVPVVEDGTIWAVGSTVVTGKIVLGAGWTVGGTFGIAGKGTLTGTSSTTGSVKVTAYGKGFRVFSIGLSGGATWSARLDTDAFASYAGNGTGGLLTTTVTAAAYGVHTLEIKSPTSNVWFFGFEPIIETGMTVSRCAIAGATVKDYAVQPDVWTGRIPEWEFTNPNLSLIALGYNDHANQFTIASFTANYNLLVDKALGQGQCMVVVPPYPQTESGPITYQSYVDAIYGIAAARNLPLVDIGKRWGGKYNATFQADNIHPNQAGFYDIAKMVYDAIMNP